LVFLTRVAFPNTTPVAGNWAIFAKGLCRVEEAWLALKNGDECKEALEAIAAHMICLKRLRFRIPLEVSLGNLKPFPRLRHVFLRGSGDVHHHGHKWTACSSELTDTMLRTLLKNARALEAIDVSFNLKLSGESAQTLGSHPSLRTIRWQHLGHLVHSSHHWPSALRQSATLRRLDVSFLQPCPDDGSGGPRDICALRQSLPNVLVVAESAKDSNSLTNWVPAGWPPEECVW